MKGRSSTALLLLCFTFIAPVPISSFLTIAPLPFSSSPSTGTSSASSCYLHQTSTRRTRSSGVNENDARRLAMTSQAVDLSLLQPVPADGVPPSRRVEVNGEEQPPAAKLGLHLKLGSKVLPLYGVLFAAQAWLSAIIMFPLCFAAGLFAALFDWKRMRPPAAVAQVWGRLVLLTMGCRPRVEGAELLPPPEEAVVFVANHGSYLDIPVTNFLPRLCKYLMKAELRWLPIVGWKAVVARDIFVHRQTSATFRRLLEATTRGLKAGNSIMTFPEGTRSKDGKVGEFKRGPFTMAQRAGVRVVPISISGVAKAMPPFALAPICRPQNVRLRVHPPISTDGRKVKEVMSEARRAVCSGLESWQQPDDLSQQPPPIPEEKDANPKVDE